MDVKLFEIRDAGTFIPVYAFRCRPSDSSEAAHEAHRENWLLWRSGFSNMADDHHVILGRLEAAGVNRNASYDVHAWGGRTYPVAHQHIVDNWNQLKSGDVIDVEFILGITKAPKTSEQLDEN